MVSANARFEAAMARIRNFLLPNDINEELAIAAEGIPDDLVLEWGREYLPGGFTRADTIRERLIARIRSEATLDRKVLEMLDTGLALTDFVSALSFSALQFLYLPATVVFGRAPLLAAMLIDSREEVHKFAAEQAAKPPEPNPNYDFELSKEFIANFFETTFLDSLDIQITGEEPEEPESVPPPEFFEGLRNSMVQELDEKIVEQRKRIEHLNNELHQQKQRHLAKLKQQAEAADREKKALRAEATKAQSDLARALKEKQALERQLAEVSAGIEAAVIKGVEMQTSAIVRKWLAAPAALEAASAQVENRGKGLLARVEQVLAAQARQDRHAGNRLELERRLEPLREAERKLSAALADALRPVPELKPLLVELKAEIGRIQGLLNEANPDSEIARRLLVCINTAGTWEEVRGCSQLLEQLNDFGLLPSEDARPVYSAIQRKFSLLEENQRSKSGEGDNGWSLRDTLFRNKTALLILDGHNLLFGLKDVFGADYENGYPGRKARQKLVDVVGRLVRGRSNVRTKVCFDGPDAGTVPVAPNLEVLYSGGEGRNRADELIVSHLQFKDLKDLQQKVFVVSDDREVRRGIVRAGASYVACDLFAVFLNDFGCLARNGS